MGYNDIYSKAAAENLRRATDEAINCIEDLQKRLNTLSRLEASETNTSSEMTQKPATIEMVASEGDSSDDLRNDVYDYIARYVYGGADSGATERLFGLLQRQAEIAKATYDRGNLSQLYTKAYKRVEELEAENRKLEEARDYWIGQHESMQSICDTWEFLYREEKAKHKSGLEKSNDFMREMLGDADV